MQCRRCKFNLWVRKIPGRRKWQPTPVFLPEKLHVQRSFVGHSLWGRRSCGDTTEQLNNNNINCDVSVPDTYHFAQVWCGAWACGACAHVQLLTTCEASVLAFREVQQLPFLLALGTSLATHKGHVTKPRGVPGANQQRGSQNPPGSSIKTVVVGPPTYRELTCYRRDGGGRGAGKVMFDL